MKIMYGYKLFEQDSKGNIYPLFIDKKEWVRLGRWLPAKFVPTKGFAPRGGWHIGTIPDAPWLRSADGSYRSQRGKTFKRVWGLVRFNVTNDYNDYVRTLPKKCIVDGCPVDGYYVFREVGKGDWYITSDLFVERVLTDEEVENICLEMGHDRKAVFEPYRLAMMKSAQTRLAKHNAKEAKKKKTK